MKNKVFNGIKQFFLRIVGKRFLINQFLNRLNFWFVMYLLMVFLYLQSFYYSYQTISLLENRVEFLRNCNQSLKDYNHISDKHLIIQKEQTK